MKLIGVAMILFVLGAMLHVHLADLTGTPCLVCINAQTSAPTALFLPQVVLVKVAAVAQSGQLQSPTSSPKLSSFIRPPPAH